MTGTTQEPRRYQIGEPFRLSAASAAGTTVVRPARPYGYGSEFATDTPCCRRAARVNAVDATYAGRVGVDATGVFKTCPGCGWKWLVRLTRGGQPIPQLDADAAHPHIGATEAEWISRGFGTRPRRSPGRRAARFLNGGTG